MKAQWLALALCVLSCKRESDRVTELPAVPHGLPPRPARADAVTPAKIELGRALFFDDRMSKFETTACADCHQPSHGWSAKGPGSVNAAGKVTRRKSPTVLGAGRHPLLAWDGRAKSLEEITNIAWTGQLSAEPAVIATRLDAIAPYHAMFEAAFGTGATPDAIARAIAAFLSVLETGDSPFDRGAMNAEAQRGEKAFTALGCQGCHAGPTFTDEQFHAVGTQTPNDPGREEATHDPNDRGKFRTPSLRAATTCGPWLHDGSGTNLDDVIRKMIAGGNELATHAVREEDVHDLHAFFDALSGTVTVPPPKSLPGGHAVHDY